MRNDNIWTIKPPSFVRSIKTDLLLFRSSAIHGASSEFASLSFSGSCTCGLTSRSDTLAAGDATGVGSAGGGGRVKLFLL